MLNKSFAQLQEDYNNALELIAHLEMELRELKKELDDYI